jgi:hypothetical protein
MDPPVKPEDDIGEVVRGAVLFADFFIEVGPFRIVFLN